MRLSVGFTGRIELIANCNETTICVLGFCVGPPGHFELGFFTSRVGRCAALGFFYVVHLEMDNSLKWVLFNKVSGQITSDALWK